MTDILKNQAVIVFGATGRVGADVCRILADNGASVVVHYHSNRKAAEEIVAQIEAKGGAACAIQADVTDEKSIQAFPVKRHLDLLCISIADSGDPVGVNKAAFQIIPICRQHVGRRRFGVAYLKREFPAP